MANDLTTTATTDLAEAGPRDLAWRALSLHPSTTTTLASQLGPDAPACIAAAIATIEHDLRPVPIDRGQRREWVNALDERLRRLAVKVLPTAKSADTEEWRKAMGDALSDLPAMVALTAAKRAIHRPFRFIGEIEVAVREIAAELMEDREQRLAAMRRHREEIERALNPAAPLLAAPVDDAEITIEQVRAMTPELRRMGVRAGWITQEQVDTILAHQADADAGGAIDATDHRRAA